MKRKLLITSSMLMLMALVLASGCAQQTKTVGIDYYAEDVYKMVPRAEHEKRFPHGHMKKAGDENKRCYYNEGTAAYFCQYWGDWDE